jgi:hypothetical protein
MIVMPPKKTKIKVKIKIKSFDITDLSPTDDAYVYTNAAQSATCPTGSYAKKKDGANVRICTGSSSIASRCMIGYFEVDPTSISSGATIQNVVYHYHVKSVSNPRNCHIVPCTIQPSTATAKAVWDDVHAQVNAGNIWLSGTDAFNTPGGPYQLDLGSIAAANLQANLNRPWWAFAIVHANESREAGVDHINDVAAVEDATPNPFIRVSHI